MGLQRTIANYLITSSLFGKLGYLFRRSARKRQYDIYRSKYDLHPKFDLNEKNPDIELTGSGTIDTGKNSYLGRNTAINAVEDSKVEIGDNCAISHYVRIHTRNRQPDQDLGQNLTYSTGDVKIRDNVWIGAYVFITKDTIIRENTVIGAHSMVTRDIPPHSIVVGSPAKVMKFKSYLDEQKINELAVNYWDVLSNDLQQELRPKIEARPEFQG